MFGHSGLVVPTWPVAYGGLDLTPAVARAIEAELRPYNLGRLNPLGLNLRRARAVRPRHRGAAPPLPPADRAQRRGVVPAVQRAGRRAPTSPRSRAGPSATATSGWSPGRRCGPRGRTSRDFGVLLARTDADVPKRKGITYFLIDLHQPGVEVRPLRHIGGEVDFNEVFLDGARVPDTQRVGEVGDGWKVANATLSGERQMVSGSGSGGVDRIGGSGVERLIRRARSAPRPGSPAGGTTPSSARS